MEERNSIFADVLELIGNFIYEYNPANDEFCVYVVSNGREVLARKISDFKVWKEKFPAEHILAAEEDTFKKMCCDIIDLKEIKASVHTDYFNNGDGEFHHFDIVGKKHSNPDGTECSIGFISMSRKEESDLCKEILGVELIKDAGVDVYNKKSIIEYCKHLIEEAPEKSFYIALFDLDNFKNINDNFGHFYGDDVLIATTDVLKQNVGEFGKVGRVGGDEFLVVFDKISDREEMRLLMKKTRENIEARFKGKTGDFALTCSAGCAPYPDCGNNFEDLYKSTDAMLYLAKEKGRNRYILYREDLHQDLVKSVIDAKGEKPVSQIYDAMTAKWNPSSVMERFVRDYFVEGTISLMDLLEQIENRFLVDYIQIVAPGSRVVVERLNNCVIESGNDIRLVEFNDKFLELMMGNNFFIANSIASFRDVETDGKKIMKEKKIQNAIFYRGEDGSYVLFGKIYDNRKWAGQDSLVLTTMAQLILLKIK